MRGAPAVSNPDAPAPTSGSTDPEPTAIVHETIVTESTTTVTPLPPAATQEQTSGGSALTETRDTGSMSSRDYIETTQKILAAVQGAIEGLQEALARENLGRDAGRAYAQVAATADAVREEVRSIGQDPAMQRAGSAMSRAGQSVAGTASNATHAVGDSVHSATTAVKDRATAMKDRTVEAKDAVVHKVEATVDDVRRKAGAVRETASRAREAPGKIITDYKEGVKGWSSKMGASLGLFVLAGALGITFLVIYAIWQTSALSALFGFLVGSFLSALIFAVLAAIVVGVARSRAAAAGEKMAEARRKVREDIDYVKRPVASEFGARRGV